MVSRENVEIVRRSWDAWIEGDLDTLLGYATPELEWDTRTFDGWPENGIYRGHAGFRRFLEEWLGSWERFEAGADDFIEAEDARVLVICWQRGYGPGSHVPVQMDYAVLCTLDCGLISHMEAYSDRAKALKAAGLTK